MKGPSIVLIAALLAVIASARFFQRSAPPPPPPQLPEPAQVDQYGGSPQLHCANRTGHFILTKMENRWWFCDPAGNVLIAMSVGNVTTNGKNDKDCNGALTYPIFVAKYGDVTFNWGWQTLKRLKSWGFNSIGQDSGPFVQPDETCPRCDWPNRRQPIRFPSIIEFKPAEYASVNVFGILSEPIKDIISGANNNYDAWRGGAFYDLFDPKLKEWWQKALTKRSNPAMQKIRRNDPYVLAILTDDSDYFWGAGAGPDFASGHTSSNVAWMTLITSPVQTYIQTTPFENKRFIYEQTEVYSKAQATNPTTPCSTANPCSLRDYLWQKYRGDIAALNKAWGSNYTTFDSTGKSVTGEVIATGDGTTTSFTHKLAHFPVSPYSVLILDGGSAKAGDCPWFHRGCIERTSGRGSIGSAVANYLVQASSSINYADGTVTISFVSPPPRGAPIAANYIYGGWMAGGTGLLDEDGSHKSWLGTNPFCLEGPDPNFPNFFSCKGKGWGDNGKPNANPRLASDLDDWVPQMSARYFKTMHDELKDVSKIPYFGLDMLGSYGAPAYSKFLEGAAPYIDGAFVSLKYWQPLPTPAAFESAYQYLTRYLGDVPFMTFSVISAQADSSMSCYRTSDSNNMPDQARRGEMWFDSVQYLLNTNGQNHDIQFVGADWWSWQDFQHLDQGLVSVHDNAYDGHEDVSPKVSCSPPLEKLSCGGEAGNYGDVISPVARANALWYKFTR